MWVLRAAPAIRQPLRLVAVTSCAAAAATTHTSTPECGSATASSTGAATSSATRAVSARRCTRVSEQGSQVRTQAGHNLPGSHCLDTHTSTDLVFSAGGGGVFWVPCRLLWEESQGPCPFYSTWMLLACPPPDTARAPSTAGTKFSAAGTLEPRASS